jgi:hypothetical protein
MSPLEAAAKALAEANHGPIDWEYCRATPGHPIYHSSMVGARSVLFALANIAKKDSTRDWLLEIAKS